MKLDEKDYLPRVADRQLAQLLRTSGAILIKGPKWCGKTATAEHRAASAIYMQDPDKRQTLLGLADTKPSVLLAGAEPRLIDEWQMAPQLWDAVRFAVDRGTGRGRFILTGSSTPGAAPSHSGVGRIARLEMHTMSLYESGDSSGEVSLAALFDGQRDIGAIATKDVEDYARLLCRGGWPEAVAASDADVSLAQAQNYVRELLDSDIDQLGDKRRNATWLRLIMRSYARNVSTEAPLTTIAADMEGEPPSMPTVADYVDALARTYVVEDLEAWNPSLRSKTAVRTSPTRHFTDPSIAAAVLGATPEKLLFDFETFGLMFESMCVRDLRVYAAPLGGRVYHYRDKTGLEADAVVVLPDGRWAPIEVKLGGSKVDDAADDLRTLANRIDQAKMGAPSFLMVLTGTQAAYERDDGVLVVPLACLAP